MNLFSLHLRLLHLRLRILLMSAVRLMRSIKIVAMGIGISLSSTIENYISDYFILKLPFIRNIGFLELLASHTAHTQFLFWHFFSAWQLLFSFRPPFVCSHVVHVHIGFRDTIYTIYSATRYGYAISWVEQLIEINGI